MTQITLKPELANLYETDYLAWIELTVAKLRSPDFAKLNPDIDWENLIF